MHELALTQGIINIISAEQKKNGFRRVIEIRLRVGEFSGVIPQCIEEFFPIAASGTSAENARIVIESVEAKFKCLDCGFEGAIDRKKVCCPDCGSECIRMTAGREFFVEDIKVE